jgi:glycosyltransferase involved in cell wall biosynthesis
MKVLHCCLANFYIDNYGYQENILPKMHKLQGHDVAIVASTETYVDDTTLGYVEPSSYESESGIPVTRLPYLSFLPHLIARKLRIYTGLSAYIESFMPDVIFVHDLQFISIRQIALFAQRHPQVRVYVDSHTDLVNSAKNWVSRNILHRIIYRWCAREIEPVTTKFYGVLPLRVQFLSDMYGISPDRIEYLPLGVDDTEIDFSKRAAIRKRVREHLGLSDDDFVVVTGGKLDARKKVGALMTTIRDLNIAEIKLIVFGTPSQDTREEIESLSKHENISCVGWIAASSVYDYFMASDLAVFPGTHSVLWEQAVGVGIPCLFREWSGMKHVDIGGNCLFLKTGDVPELSETILRVFNQSDLYSTMQRVARKDGMSKFSYFQIAKTAIAA